MDDTEFSIQGPKFKTIGVPEDLVAKSNRPPQSGSAALSHLNPDHKKGPYTFKVILDPVFEEECDQLLD